jgi:hypothetical protein
MTDTPRGMKLLALGLVLLLLSACSGGKHADPHPAQAVRSALAGTDVAVPANVYDSQLDAFGNAMCGRLDRGEDAGSIVTQLDGSFVKGLAFDQAVVHAYCPKYDSAMRTSTDTSAR